MCEMLIMREDATDDPTVGAPMRGDVVTIKPDGWEWGRRERERMIIHKRPGEPVEKFARLLGTNVPHGALPLYRAFFLDLRTREIYRREPTPLMLEA